MDRAEIIARALHIARRQLRADGGSVADDFLPRLAPTPQTAHNYGRAPIFDEYGQPHDPITGTKLESPDPSLSESLYNIATSPARVAVGAVTEPISAAGRLPYETLTGVPEIDVRAKNDALALLSALYGGNAFNPLARMPANSIGMFAGRMAKTADQDALARAESLQAQGVPREQIWNDTGWFQGADGKWRFEIDDSGQRLLRTRDDLERVSRPMPSDMVFQHDALHQAYPSVAEVPWYLTSEMEGGGASYDPLRGIRVGGAPSYASGKSGIGGMTLHEQQHAIQDIEDFGRGGNRDFNLPLEDVRREAQNAYEFNLSRPKDADDVLLEELGFARPTYQKAWQDLSPREQMVWYDAGRGRVYNRLAGEVEARNVQSRMGMNSQERRATPPWTTEDVPSEQQIVRFK